MSWEGEASLKRHCLQWSAFQIRPLGFLKDSIKSFTLTPCEIDFITKMRGHICCSDLPEVANCTVWATNWSHPLSFHMFSSNANGCVLACPCLISVRTSLGQSYWWRSCRTSPMWLCDWKSIRTSSVQMAAPIMITEPALIKKDRKKIKWII